ncbi:MAG: hypothetical protein KC586_15515 [Myxococcales bacterium]|nr:hypothetical protein [Myxococcales bacterium]
MQQQPPYGQMPHGQTPHGQMPGTFGPGGAPPGGMPNAKLPGSTTFVGVGALIFALLGFCGSGLGLLGQAQQGQQQEQVRQMQAQFGNEGGMGSMMEEMAAVQEKMFLPTLAMQLIFFLVAAMLAAVGFFVLTRNTRATSLGPQLLFAAAGLSVLGTALEIWAQHETMSAMTRAMEGGGPGAAMLDGMMGFGLAFAYGCAGGWLLLKLGFVFWGASHLRKPEIAGFFGGARALGPRGE